MSYIAPHLRRAAAAAAKAASVPPTSVDTSSETLFPSLGARAATSAPTQNFANLDWKDATKVSEEEREAQQIRESLREARAALRAFYLSAPPPKPYITNDERYEAYLAEQDYLDALKYDAANPLPEAPPASPAEEDGWETTARRTRREKAEVQFEEVEERSQEEIRERMTFLQKRLRRNGILREDKDAYEKELRELEKELYDSD